MAIYLTEYPSNRIPLPLSLNDPALAKGEVFALYGYTSALERRSPLLDYLFALCGAQVLGSFYFQGKEYFKKDGPFEQYSILPSTLAELEYSPPKVGTDNNELFKALEPLEPLLAEEGYSSVYTDYTSILFLVEPKLLPALEKCLEILSRPQELNYSEEELLRLAFSYQLEEARLFSMFGQVTGLEKTKDFSKACEELLALREELFPNAGPSKDEVYELAFNYFASENSFLFFIQPFYLDLIPLGKINVEGKAFVCDMDATAIYNEGLDMIAKELGLGEEVEKITKQAMEGSLDFAESFKARVALLANKDASVLDRLKKDLIINQALPFVVKYLETEGYHTVLCSGGIVPFASYIASLGGFKDYHANNLELIEKDGKTVFSGKALDPIVDASYKAKILASFNKDNLEHYGIAAGDGANDIPMLKLSTLGLSYHGKAKVKPYANLKIERNSLMGLVIALEMKKLFQ